jgi:hypothetical protein
VHSLKTIAAGVALVLAATSRPVHAGTAPVCEPVGRTTATIELVPPAGVGLAGVKVRLEYPEQQVAMPGRGDDAEVRGRVGGMPGGVMGQPNDEDDALIIALVSTSPIPKGPIVTVAFDSCRGAARVDAERFACAIEQASDEQGRLVSGAMCRVTIRNDEREVES